MTEAERVTDMVSLLDIEIIDKDIYRGYNEKTAAEWPALFGGQVVAQALRAAAYTVNEERLPHSLHGYFLRPGVADIPVLLQVSRDRDGRSFSARHVVAIQHGEVIFSMSASFHVREPGATFVGELPEPSIDWEDLEEAPLYNRFEATLRIRPFPRRGPADGVRERFPARVWVRVEGDLPDDPVVHACALAYISDLGSGFAETTVPGLPQGGPSFDHALWFHDQVRADDWLRMEMWPLKAGSARGLYEGSVHDARGRLAAMLTQETLLRPPRE